MRRAVPPVACAVVAACAFLAACGSSPKSTILTLDLAAPQAVRADYRGPPIAIPAVHVPAALDRAEFASQPAAATLAVDDFARWSAPLGVLARDALVRDLIQRLPAGAVLPPGAVAPASRAVTYDVTITAIDFTGGAAIQAAFRSLPGGRPRIVAYADAAAGATPAARAAALSGLLGRLADDIAADAAAKPGLPAR